MLLLLLTSFFIIIFIIKYILILAVIVKAEVVKQNLQVQHEKVSAEIGILEKKLADKKEYLAKIEGGIDVVDELLK